MQRSKLGVWTGSIDHWKVLKRATLCVKNWVLIKGERVGPQCGASPHKTFLDPPPPKV